MKDVAVTHESGGVVGVLAWFDTVPEAERFIACRAKEDPEGVEAGHYGVDAGCLEAVA
jgi:hypothetical protein